MSFFQHSIITDLLNSLNVVIAFSLSEKMPRTGIIKQVKTPTIYVCVLGEIYLFEIPLLYRFQPIAKESMTHRFPEIDPTGHWAHGWW